ncbi:MAG: molybdopterin molybdotransferase MoeA [Synergistaceae bacterium]|jgi:molybdopterin molybdotransferase|nr:molybdopterin molybdotransferase MoeA [Synergistaceae bacterium]
MSGFVEEIRPIDDCLEAASKSLGFPWDVKERRVSLQDALGARSSRDIRAPEPYPPFTRSLRDGYALDHSNTIGASAASPVFLRMAGEVMMGEEPSFELSGEETAAIPTGGILPNGADAVVMIEDTTVSCGWVEVRKAVQRNENLVCKGEEVAVGDVLIKNGDLIGCAVPGMLGSFGISEADVQDVKIGIISTGDEIVPVSESPPVGFIRDANTNIIQSVLRRYGWVSLSYGIVSDEWHKLKARTDEALAECDVVLLSGGSSVGMRDNTAKIMSALASPGLVVRGINMTPGKPTLIGGSSDEKKLIVGLPGHPLSCMTTAIFVVMPLLLAMSGVSSSSSHAGRYMELVLADDVQGRAGADEFIPMRVEKNRAHPMAAKSGYVSAARDADGFIRLRPNTETLRKGENAEVWIW